MAIKKDDLRKEVLDLVIGYLRNQGGAQFSWDAVNRDLAVMTGDEVFEKVKILAIKSPGTVIGSRMASWYDEGRVSVHQINQFKKDWEKFVETLRVQIGLPPVDGAKRMTHRFYEADRKRLDQLAKHLEVSKSEIMRQALEDYHYKILR